MKSKRHRYQKVRLETQAQVLELLNLGVTYKDIASQIDQSINTIGYLALKFRRQGIVQERPRGGIHRLEDDELGLRMIEMRRQGWSIGRIGKTFGVSRSAVSQKLRKLSKKHGPGIFQSENPPLTFAQAASTLGISRKALRRVIAAQGIETVHWYRHKNALAPDVVERLRNYLGTQKRQCRECSAWFNPYSTVAKYCSAECRKRVTDWQRTNPMGGLTGWRQPLVQRLKQHRIPENEEWLGLRKAKNIAGLTTMQLSYLRMRQVITFRTRPTNGLVRPRYHLYAKSELEIVRQVIAEKNGHLPGVGSES